jgi:hypothetical protein
MISVLAAAFLLVASLGASFQGRWATSNSQGPITYTVREAGLPLQYVILEVSSPVGPSSFFKVDLLLLVSDFVIWACLAYGILYLLRLPKKAVAPVQTPPTST